MSLLPRCCCLLFLSCDEDVFADKEVTRDCRSAAGHSNQYDQFAELDGGKKREQSKGSKPRKVRSGKSYMQVLEIQLANR